jgi:putative tryptophan/tyrosine transport system substrate-binding protein
MRRREFIAGLGSAAAWPPVARAQRRDRVRRIGVLMVFKEDDVHAQIFLSGFVKGLADFGWSDGRNMRLDVRWASGNVNLLNTFGKELVDLQPDLILVGGDAATAAAQRITRTIPIIFVNVADPVGSGFVGSLRRPGGNITGFGNQEASLASKWLEALVQIAPGVKRAAILFNPQTAPGAGTYYLPSFEAAAVSLGIEPIAAPTQNDKEIEETIASLAKVPGGGLSVMTDSFTLVHRTPIILAAARYKVPAVYWSSNYVREGGLISYGPDFRDSYSRAAPYADRILRGADPAELPVQLPVKFEMVLNRGTATALGIEVPQSILLRADEVIE